MVILGVFAGIIQYKLIDQGYSSENRAIEAGILELNAMEKITWTKLKFSPSGWTNDNAVFAEMDMNLGEGYSWIAGPTFSGGTLQFKSKSVVLTRAPSTNESAGWWK